MNYGTSFLEELVHCQIYVCALVSWASLVAQTVKDLPAMQETRVQTLEWDDPLEKGMATRSSIPAWRVSWIEKPGRQLFIVFPHYPSNVCRVFHETLFYS